MTSIELHRLRACLLLYSLAAFAVPATSQAATVKPIYTFTGNGPDGYAPTGTLIRDKAGALFGVTLAGGTAGKGAVFKLSPPRKGQAWQETVLYSFQGGTDGQEPNDGLIEDKAGDLLGITSGGGAAGDGTIFLLTPSPADPTGYIKSTIYSFSGADGSAPYYGLTADGAGAYDGTTTSGGAGGSGTIFKLSPPAQGNGWTLTTLHDFVSADGIATPVSTLTPDGAGTLYGTTLSSHGAVYAFTPANAGGTLKVLYTFLGLNDGQSPYGGVTLTAAGDLVGSTYFAGVDGYGTVYKLSPNGAKWNEKTVGYFDGIDCGNGGNKLLVASSGKMFGTASQPGCVFAVVPRMSGKGYSIRSLTNDQLNTLPNGGLVADPVGNLFGANQQGGNVAGQIFEVLGAHAR